MIGEQLPEHFQQHFNEYLSEYLRNKVFLPAEIANEFVEFVYTKHEDFNQDLLMEELKKAMRIHMYLNKPKKDKETERLI
jgi:hypothetical protein